MIRLNAVCAVGCFCVMGCFSEKYSSFAYGAKDSQLSWATVFLGRHLGGHYDLVVFHGDGMGAVLDQVVEIQVFGDLCRLACFSAVVSAGQGENIDHGPIVINSKVERTGGVPATDIDGRGEFVTKGDPHVDVVPVLTKQHFLDLGGSQIVAVGDKDADG